jgi:hypothetical protein
MDDQRAIPMAECAPACEAPRPRNEEVRATLAPLASGGYRDVSIKKVANGFVLIIGCQTFVAKTWDEASDGLRDYWKDPVAAEKKYCAAR